ncbi:MAG: hypothetical protein JWN44_1689 [Myxococcales bacterium]|nr:hypothetical protein [Myxococcales bacterium]
MALPPVLRSALTLSAWRLVARPVVLTGGALLLGGLFAASIGTREPCRATASAAASYRLVLETQTDPQCVYGSAWNGGDVVLSHDASDGRTVTLTSRYDFADGCTWEALEVLTPSGDGYAYSYEERAVECPPAATVGNACPRTGHVTVVPNTP